MRKMKDSLEVTIQTEETKGGKFKKIKEIHGT